MMRARCRSEGETGRSGYCERARRGSRCALDLMSSVERCWRSQRCVGNEKKGDILNIGKDVGSEEGEVLLL